MLNAKFLLSLAALMLVGCQSIETSDQDPGPTLPPDPAEALRKAYAETYAAFKSNAFSVPDFEDHMTSSVLFRETPLNDGLILRLRAGRLIKPSAGMPHRLRSASRYQIIQADRVVFETESMLTKDMPPELVKDSHTGVLWHSQSRHVLIEEERDWSNIRHIAIWPAGSGEKEQWRSKIIHVPLRSNGPAALHPEGKILGIAEGRLFVEVDGTFYAFPLDELEEAPVEFSTPG